MTSTLPGPGTTARETPDTRPAGAPPVTSLDLLALGAVAGVGAVAWAALGLAELGAFSLPAVLALAAAVLVPAGLAVRTGLRGRLRADRAGVLVALGCAAVAAVLTFPGFDYGVADKDPGGYVSHAIEISDHHDYAFTDPLLATQAKDPTFPVALTSPGARFPGVWVHDAAKGEIVPQFYHLWPSLMAVLHSAGGTRGLTLTAPLVGVVSVLLACALLRRLGDALTDRTAGRTAGLVAAGAGGLLLATNMLQVWQSRYPTTELLAQALYVGALLGVVVALQTRWWPAAALAGVLTGLGWLNRPDGVLLVLMAAGVGAALLATRRWNASCTAFAGGLLVVLPHAFLQAYDLCKTYTLGNSVPSARALVLFLVVLAVGALAVRRLAAGPVDRLLASLERPTVQRRLGLLVVAGALGLMALGFLRPRLFGATHTVYAGGRVIPTYDELILRRLSWFFTLPGFAVMQLGVMVLVLRRWRASLWVLLVPTLSLFALYGYTARNSTRLLWWSRRYVPTVLPGVVMLIALALAWFVVTRVRGRALLRVPALAVLVGLLAVFLSQSLPLRAHDEWKGSFQVSQRIAALAGDQQGIFVWEAEQPCCAGVTALFATPVWLQRDQVSALLPGRAAYQQNPTIRRYVLQRYVQRFPGRPVFVVADNGQLPEGIDPASVQPAATFRVSLPMWQESDLERPHYARTVKLVISVWRVRA